MQYDKSYPGVTEVFRCLRLLPYQTELLEQNPYGTELFFDFETKYRGEILVCDSDKAVFLARLDEIKRDSNGQILWVLKYPRKVVDVPVIMTKDWEENHFEKGYIMEYPKTAKKWLRIPSK